MINKSPPPLTDPQCLRRMQCLRPIVSYTDIDGQCDKLVTENVTSLQTDQHWPST